MKPGGELDNAGSLQGAVEDQAGIALDLGDVVAVAYSSWTTASLEIVAAP